jgi:hypothetical protein
MIQVVTLSHIAASEAGDLGHRCDVFLVENTKVTV